MISVVILTKNEEENIKRCLESLLWCDEKLIIDDLSSDKTIAIARKSGTTIYQHKINGDFASQRNYALEKAQGDWVLFVDADEIVSDRLVEEIEKKIGNSKANGFYLRRRDIFLGQPLNFGETGNFSEIRLGKKGVGEWQRKVHEIWKITAPVDSLKNPLIHYSHPTIKSFLTKLNYYTDLDAREFLQKGKKFSYFDLMLKPPTKFFFNYFLHAGFLDGLPGFIMAFMMSLNSLIVRVKMYENDKV